MCSGDNQLTICIPWARAVEPSCATCYRTADTSRHISADAAVAADLECVKGQGAPSGGYLAAQLVGSNSPVGVHPESQVTACIEAWVGAVKMNSEGVTLDPFKGGGYSQSLQGSQV